MIKTIEEYEEIKRDVNFDISTQHEKSLLETIQALRNVARAADTVRELPANEAYYELKEALDALPAWMLEDERP